ncbi:MAG: cytochrome-c oxidase, cbb3-type subunit II [Leptospirales bacterium]|nr:cytochrome-c oxidase, cbb3-type subunit II [Leptospirales bacterium]
MSNENLTWYEKLSHAVEGKAFKFTVFTTIAILVGGLVELPPFFMVGAVERIPTVTPYAALELAGRDVYQQEGCFYCHTQVIRPFKWETDRWDRNREYGPEPYSKAGEFVYEHPFLWGSKRTGPDLAHEASLNSNPAWHKQHLMNPRETSPDSIMPAYPWLFETKLDPAKVQASMRALKSIGVPYTDADIQNAAQATQGKTEGDALIAYLLKLGRDTIVK